MSKYLKRDSDNGFVEDYVEIQSLKFDNARHAVLGNMLGDFDEQGYYRVSPEIVKELIEMPKYVVEVMDNLEVCLSILKLDKQISFLVAYEGEKATLSLIEKVSFEANNKLDSGTWSNVNEYVLDIVETNGEIDRQALYMKWNIQTFPGQVIDIFNCDESVLEKYFNIIARFKQNIEAKTSLLKKEDEIEEIEAEYALDLFQILNGYPELMKAVQKQLKQTLTEKKDFVKVDKPNFTKTINEILNKTVDNNIGVLSENQQQAFKTEKRNITVKANIKKYDTFDIGSEMVDTVEDRQELDPNIEPINDEKSFVTKFSIKNVKYQSLNDISQRNAKTEMEVLKNAKNKAIAMIGGDGKSKVAKVLNEILKSGVSIETITSESVIAAAEANKAKQKPTEKAADNEKAVSKNPEKQAEKKQEEKKDKKKPENKKQPKKEPKKQPQKEDKTKTNDKDAKVAYVGSSSSSSSKNVNKSDENDNKPAESKGRLAKAEGLIGQRVGTDKNTTQEDVMNLEKLNQIMAERNNLLAKQNEANNVKNPVRVREQAAPATAINDTMGV